MEKSSQEKLKLLGNWLVSITLIGVFILPSIEFSSQTPKIEISDLTLLPLFLLSIIYFRGNIISFFSKHKWVCVTFAGLIVIGVFSIVLNGRFLVYRDWFEPLKFFKLLSFLFFFYFYIDLSKWQPFIKMIFLVVVLFNFCHYIDLWNFNTVISPYYSADHHLSLFGLNSIGLPATKRMLGTLGNPNNNAVMFLIFLVFFLPRTFKRKNAVFPLVLISIVGVFACQSRTGFLALIFLLLFYFFGYRFGWKNILIYCFIFVVGQLLFQFMGNTYVGTISNGEVLESVASGRFQQWDKIIASMPGHWFFGHGVNKEYFELNEIHPESEYFLILFRYGVVGVLILISFWIVLIVKCIRNWGSPNNMLLIGTIIIFIIVGIMNAPMHSNKLSLMLVLALGIALARIDERKTV